MTYTPPPSAPRATQPSDAGGIPPQQLLGRPQQPRRRVGLAKVTAWSVWLYAAAVVAVLVLLRVGGDRWWFATMILFGPRWVCALPLVVLIPLCALTRRRMLLPLTAAAMVVVGPIMGGCFLPWGRLTAPAGPAVRVLTCNLKGKCINNAVLEELIRTATPDIVALQGVYGVVQIALPAGWHVRQQGEFLIASRFPLRHPSAAYRRHPSENWRRVDVLSCLVEAPAGDFSFCTLHLQSPHEGIQQLFDHRTVINPSASPGLEAAIEDRWQEADKVAQWLKERADPLIVVGDFNAPPDSAIYRSFWSSYRNAFTAAGLGFGYTEWPQVRKIPFGIRIDHVLTGPGWRPRRCWVGPDVGSDHLPLVADLVREQTSGETR